MNTTSSIEGNDTFEDLCKELGKRARASGVENALLCHRAYLAYLGKHPNTAHGKGNKKDRDATRSFRHEAAEASGLAVGTIDALLQVGKAIEPLPPDVRDELVSSSLGCWMRALRKLATTEFEATRAQLITKFAKQEKTNPESARASLKKKLGIKAPGKQEKDAPQSNTPDTTPGARERGEAKWILQPESHLFAEGAELHVTSGGITLRVVVGGYADGRVQLTAMAFTGEPQQIPALPPAEQKAPTESTAEVGQKKAA